MSTFIEQEFHKDPGTNPHIERKATCRSIFCSKIGKGVIIALFIAIIVPTVAYIFVISRNVPEEDDSDTYYCLIREEYRISCGNAGISETDCNNANCCYNSTTKECHHYLPSKYFYKPQGSRLYKTSQSNSPVNSTSLEMIQLTIQNKTANKLSLIIHDPQEEVEQINFKHPNYTIVQASKKLVLEVYDQDGDSIFSSAKGALIASENYWEWSFQLSNGTLFGLDRNLIDFSGMKSLTKVIYKSQADHSTMPMFWAYQNGKFHGVAIRHDGPLEIQVLPSNMIILRSLVGRKIEIELSLGPTPADLYKSEVNEVAVPPLWSLGTHNCRKGDLTSLSELLKIYESNNKIDFTTDCVHENLFLALQKSGNTNEDLKSLIENLTNAGKKFLFSLPPHIVVNSSNTLYRKAQELDILYKTTLGKEYNGAYHKETVAYPDFSNKNITKYIDTLFDWINQTLDINSISGFILNDNWPQDEKYKTVENKFPYFSDNISSQMQYTLPWTLLGADNITHLEKHNLYGQTQASVLQSYLNSTSSDLLVISSTKRYGDSEPEISDNFDTSWDNFRLYLNKILFGSITGNEMIGLPICGDTTSYNKTLHETLCIRWYIAAATMPYFRVSSDDPFRDPSNLNSEYANNAAVLAMERRDLLQDYYFTILNRGGPLVRPMYYDYYTQTETLSIEGQYAIGKDLIVAHPLTAGKTKLQVFIPYVKKVWYEFWGGSMFNSTKDNEYVDIDNLETDWTMLVAQGTVIALTKSGNLMLYIALNCSSKTKGCTAAGELFIENTYISFTATDTNVTISDIPSSINLTVTFLKVYGYKESVGFSQHYSCNEILDGNTDYITIPYKTEL